MRPRVAALIGLLLASLVALSGCAPERCDSDRDGYEAIRCGGDDCNDATYLVHPGGSEICDLLDNDCDGEVDGPNVIEPPTWYRDADGDGYGDLQVSVQECSAPAGYVNNALDCDDSVTLNRPGGIEICDGVDNDCDGEVDDNVQFAPQWYPDTDGDGYADPDGVPVTACEVPEGYAAQPTDCDDTEAEVYPGAEDPCDGRDSNCDGVVEFLWYLDEDGDGYGTAVGPVDACTPPAGYTEQDGDCEDGDPTVHPGATEICGDGVDNDCTAGASGCGLAGTMLLSEASSFSWTSGESFAHLGTSLALGSLGASDGLSLLAGGPALAGGGPDLGRVVVLERDGFSPSSSAWTISEQAREDFGQDVRTGGDWNGDGVEDLLVRNGGNSSALGSSLVSLFAGPITSNIDSEASVASGGSDYALGQYGSGMAFLQDYDGDGDDEILISEPQWMGPAGDLRGRVLLFEGGPGKSSLAADDADYVFIDDGNPVDGFGVDIATGDFDGDGLGDLAVASPEEGPFGDVRVFFGPFPPGQGSSQDPDLLIEGTWTSTGFAGRLANGGDLDGLPGDELLIGGIARNPQTDLLGGALWVHAADSSGSLTAEDGLATLEGPPSPIVSANNLSWVFVHRAGDVNGDGQADLALVAIADQSAELSLTLFFGPVDGDRDYEDADARVGPIANTGLSSNGRVFEPLVGIGDEDGDGYDDLVLGEPGASQEAEQAGALHLLRGGPGF